MLPKYVRNDGDKYPKRSRALTQVQLLHMNEKQVLASENKLTMMMNGVNTNCVATDNRV